ncbi:MAG: hypothetical protein BGO72_08240 [Burkholderiales bacterium 70-64]|nr:MAG: hypothetical protein BGO72_08240 [Burkholderiales bacterium 70-64]
MQPTPPTSPVRRPARRAALRAVLAAAGVAWAAASPAQVVRAFPEAAKLGRFEMRIFPEAALDGQAVRLGAGARIYDARNMIVMPASLSGVFDALVERDPSGQIGRVWLLTPAELEAAQARQRERPAAASGR